MNGKTGPYVDNPYYSDALQFTAMTASSPLYALDGKLLGVLAARLDIKSFNTVISRRTNLHETDDAYLVKFIEYLSDPAAFSHRSGGELQNGVHTEDVTRCLQQQSGVMEVQDYRNVSSFVAYRWVPDRQLCLIVKIDQAEAYRPIGVFGRTIADYQCSSPVDRRWPPSQLPWRGP